MVNESEQNGTQHSLISSLMIFDEWVLCMVNEFEQSDTQ